MLSAVERETVTIPSVLGKVRDGSLVVAVFAILSVQLMHFVRNYLLASLLYVLTHKFFAVLFQYFVNFVQ